MFIFQKHIGVSILLISLSFILFGLNSVNLTTISHAAPSTYPVELIPDSLTVNGDVATSANCINPTVCSWLNSMPSGSILLGVDPSSPNPNNWNGGSVTANIFLEDINNPTLLVLKLSWPDEPGRGLRSSAASGEGTIFLDGRLLWGKITGNQDSQGNYYAFRNQPLVTTLVVTGSSTHTLKFTVSPNTRWDISQIQLSAYTYPSAGTWVKGIGYSPYRDCQSPNTTFQPTITEIEDDLFQLVHTSNAIRTYAATGVNNQIPALANAASLPVYAGAWIDGDPSLGLDGNPDDKAELDALIELADTTILAGAIVGNEYYLRHFNHPGSIAYLVEAIEYVEDAFNLRGIAVPITTAEISSFMFNFGQSDPLNTPYRPVIDRLDFIMIHIYPFWNGTSIDGAADFTVEEYLAIQDLFPGKRVIIGETGWPSAGKRNRNAIPSLENQRRYMLEFLIRANEENVEFMYFDAFDEDWKVEEPGLVGQNWGYSYSDRFAKHNFFGILLPSDQLTGLLTIPNFVFLPSVFSSQAAPGSPQEFPIYTEWLVHEHYVPSGWMGDGETPGRMSLDDCWLQNPHSGRTSVKISYTNQVIGWAGIYWLHPKDNWGTHPNGGMNLAGATRLTFWARSDTPGVNMTFLVGGIGYGVDFLGNTLCSQLVGAYPDSICPAIKQTETLSSEWTEYTIELPQGRDLSSVIGGFGWVATNKVTFYLDDIVFEYD